LFWEGWIGRRGGGEDGREESRLPPRPGGGAREASCVGLAELLPPYDKSRYLEIRNLEGEVVGKEDGS
jgi:hypothetical protein